MSNGNDKVHKRAVLEFLYSTATEAVGHAALAMVEVYGDYDGARVLLDPPLTRTGFAEHVSQALRESCGDVTIQSATVGQVADAAKAVSRGIETRAKMAAATPKRPTIMVVAASTTPAPDASPGSSDFGAN